tara:strand:- start:36217 stop:37938 length:1722 start_codon:yes stop_codon:yes gene_type:complete
MLKFIKDTFSRIISLIVFVLLVFILVVFLLPKKKDLIIEDNSILEIRLDKPILDRTIENSLPEFNGLSFSATQSLELKEILDNINRAASDPKIEGIYLRISDLNAGITQIDEIRNKLLDFKESGKYIYSYSNSFSQKSYFLNSVADKIFLHPEGNVELIGISAGIMFYKELLDKLELDIQIIRHGKFKSAVEPFMYNSMSRENRRQMKMLLNDISENIIYSISKSRNILKDDINKAINDLIFINSKACKEFNLIDEIIYEDQVSESCGIDFENKILFQEYMKNTNENNSYKNKIAIIYASGAIDLGEGSYNSIGSETTVRAIRKAYTDNDVKAIVLRVNSPGGSALASDIILREINLAKKEKTVIVSMGDYAASGGYYIACSADKIFANYSTVTGSIGVFGIIPSTQRFLKENIGLSIDTVNTHRFSDINSGYRMLTDFEKDKIQNGVENIYNTFITHVANGRSMTISQIDKLAQGRVWSGVEALSLGLVDEIGGLEDAILCAAEIAGIDKYRIISLPKKVDQLQEIFEDIALEKSGYIPKDLIFTINTIKNLNFLYSDDYIQARIPFFLEIN